MTARKHNASAAQGSARDARLAEVLATYGRNPLRWPDADRVRFANLLREPGLLPREASTEADRLDKLLDMIPAADIAEPEGARARLLALATQKPVNLAAGPARGGMRKSRWHSGFLPQQLLVAGTLAASIMLGVFVGADTEAGSVLADSLQLPGATDEVLDIVLLDDGQGGDFL